MSLFIVTQLFYISSEDILNLWVLNKTDQLIDSIIKTWEAIPKYVHQRPKSKLITSLSYFTKLKIFFKWVLSEETTKDVQQVNS